MAPHQKLANLRNRTEANGCTPGEVAAAQAAIARLLKKHPHLGEEPMTWGDFDAQQTAWNFTRKQAWNPNAAAEAVKAGFEKAKAEAAAKPKDAAYVRRQQKVRMWLDAMNEGKNVTARLRAFARRWRAAGWSRASFVEFCIAHQINAATARTQWQKSK